MSSEAEAAAVAILNAPDPSPAPSEPVPGADPTPVEAAPVPVPAAAPSPAPVDDVAELYAQLEARKAKRAAESGGAPDVISKLQSEIAELRARVAQPPAHTPQDFPALVRQHGEVEAMRMVGIDPLEFFGRFKQVAKDPDSIRRQQAEIEHQNRLKEIAEKTDKLGQTLEQRVQAEQAEATRQQWNAYVKLVESPETATPLLAKLPVQERVERTQRMIAKIHQDYGPEVAGEINDVQLAKLVEKEIRSLRDLLAGTEASATTKAMPATDGAKPQPASLTNDLASQSVGGTRQLSEKERLAAAIAIAQQAG